MDILYGGSFNPPTIAHVSIIQFLLTEFKNANIIILPTNNNYKEQHNIDFNHRLRMLEIITEQINNKRLIISNYELTLDKYYGTYYTLKHFMHPYFVIGSDQLDKIDQWIKYPDVVIENKFLVFPRSGYNINEIINNNEVLKKYQANFTILNHFEPIDISSTMFRKLGLREFVLEEVYQYICEKKLYEVKECTHMDL